MSRSPSADETMGTLRIPARAVPFILLQRPMLQRLQVAGERLGIPLTLRIGLESAVRSRTLRRGFARMMTAEYASIRPHLPARATRILDVGCGVAAIDALLFGHYGRDPGLHFFLLDRTELRRPPRYGFSTRTEFYNSLDVARRLLCANGISAANVNLVPVPEAGVPSLPEADLVVSLASWGFHYPVSAYLEAVWRALTPGGSLFLDVRSGLGEEGVLATRFADIVPICDLFEGKATRYRARKGGGVA